MQIPEPGDVLADKYRLDEVLGEGGFGVVMRATTKGTGRPVAVKILKPKRGGYEMARAARFLREMATIAKLQSPHTLTLYDYGKTDDGVLYMVCEYIDGEDLFALIVRRGQLQEREVLWILRQVLESLAEAHELGVLHRDIKPSNIRVFEYQNDPLRAKVLDFGLAKAIEPGQHANLTATNKAIGTPRYMAPEQLTGEALTPATDLYAVGLVGAEMLLGRDATAFRESELGRNLDLSAATGVSDELRELLSSLLAADPAQRPQQASEVVALLRRNQKRRRKRGERSESPSRRASHPAHVQRPPASIDSQSNMPDALILLAVTLVLVILATCMLTRMLADSPHSEPPTGQRELGSLVRRAPDSGPPNLSTPDADASTRHEMGVAGGTSGCGTEPYAAPDARVIAPPSYDSNKPYPAIVWLKADQDRGIRVPSTSAFKRLIEDEEVILIVPLGASTGDWRADQLAAVNEIVESVANRYCIRTDELFVMSNGGAGHLAVALSCEPWVKGIAVSNFSRHESGVRSCVPTLWLSARDSNYLPIDGSRSCVPLPRTIDLRPLGDIEADLQESMACRGRPVKSAVSSANCKSWNCDVPLESCVVDGGFGWPGTPAPPAVTLANTLGCDEPPPSEFDAAEYAWAFFSKYTVSAPPIERDEPPSEPSDPPKRPAMPRFQTQ